MFTDVPFGASSNTQAISMAIYHLGAFREQHATFCGTPDVTNVEKGAISQLA